MAPRLTTVLSTLGIGAAGTCMAVGLASLPVSAGADVAPPTCHGKLATIVGDREYVEGTPGDDVIYAPRSEVHALGGNDDVCAADLVYAGPGDDHVTSPGGADTEVVGGPGDDRIAVVRGYARVRAGAGDDEVVTGRGRQFVNGGPGRDDLSTGPGNDYVNGDGGVDVVRGGAGDDGVTGSQGDDTLHGGSGDDDLEGGAGEDEARGGPGRDTCDSGVETAISCRG